MGGYIVRCTWCHTDMSLYLPIIWLFLICSHWLHWKVKSSLWALAVSNGGYMVKCTWCHTDMSLYLLFIWLFWMGSHWPHWKVKSSLWALAVSNGGLIIRFTLNLKIWPRFKFSLYLPIIWLFQMGSHWLHWKVKSSLWALAVSNGGG